MFYDVLKKGMYHYKETEGGRAEVCKAIEIYGKEQRKEAKLEEKIEMTKKLIARGKMSLEEIAEDTGLSLEKVKEFAGQRTA